MFKMPKEKESRGIDNFKSTAVSSSNPGFQSSLSIASKSAVDEKPYNPFEHRDVEHPNSTLGSTVHLLKACLGSGMLAIPAAFKNSGLVAGIIGTLIAGFVCTHTVAIFVRASQELCVVVKKPSLSFSETCGAAFATGPKKIQSWANSVKNFVDYSMIVTIFGVMCVYVVFIGSSLEEVMDVYAPDFLSIQAYCAITLVPLVLICQIRNLKYLVPFTAIGNLGMFVVFAITLYYIFVDLPPVKEREMVANISTWPLFLSTAIFAMEGFGVVMPVENEMANPKRFLGCPGVLNTAMVIVISLYGVVGFFGYVQYGDEVKGSITLNLPEEDMLIPHRDAMVTSPATYPNKMYGLATPPTVAKPYILFGYVAGDVNMAQIAKLLMALVIFLSYALQCYIPMEIITRMRKGKESKYENFVQVAVRTVIVTATVAVAAAFPNLELVISFVGAVFFSTLGLLIPAVIDTVYRWEIGFGSCSYTLWKNLILAAVSLLVMFSGAYVSIVGMIEDFGSGSHESHNATLT